MMYLWLALLFLFARPIEPPTVTIVPVDGGVEARVGTYVLSGSQVIVDQKQQQVIVQGRAGVPASAVCTNANVIETTQAQRITLRLATGQIIADDR